MVATNCPACGHALHIPENLIGQWGRCKHCGEKFQASADATEVPLDIPKSAAEGNDNAVSKEQALAEAQFNLGSMYYFGENFGPDYTEAAKWITRAAEKGHVEAQSILAEMYSSGKRVRLDLAEAFTWYQKAADQGDADAQFALANMYRNGSGVDQDYSEAVKWYKKAAEDGIPLIHFDLGVMYFDGEEIPQNLVESHMWFSLAALANHEQADEMRTALEKCLTQEQITESKRLVREWREAHGDPSW